MFVEARERLAVLRDGILVAAVPRQLLGVALAVGDVARDSVSLF